MAPHARLRLIAAAVLYLLAIGMSLRVLSSLIKAPIAQWALGAVVVSVVATSAGVQADGYGALSFAKAIRGAALAGAVVVVCLLTVMLEQGASLVWAPGAPSSSILYSTLVAFVLAYRDELWLRGMPLHFGQRARLQTWLVGCYIIATGVAAILLERHTTAPGIVLTTCSGAFFAALWIKSGDLWAPVAARFVWGWLSEALLGGELLDLSKGWLPHGPAARGLSTWVASAAFLVAAGLVWRRWPEASAMSPDTTDEPPQSS